MGDLPDALGCVVEVQDVQDLLPARQPGHERGDPGRAAAEHHPQLGLVEPQAADRQPDVQRENVPMSKPGYVGLVEQAAP